MPMSLSEAKKLCEDMTAANFVMSGWKHAMEGHYDFQNPGNQPNSQKSYFTIADPTKTGNAIGSKVMDAINSSSKRVLKGDARDAKVVLLYRDFGTPIGKSSNGSDCSIMRVVLARNLQGKPIVKSCYPVSAISGSDLK
jgi:hypothetical protein